MKPVFKWVNNDEDVAELRRKDAPTIVAPVLAPNDMYFVVANMPCLLQQRLVCRGRHSGGDMEYGLNEGGGEVGSGLARQRSSVDSPFQATQKTGMCLELNLYGKKVYYCIKTGSWNGINKELDVPPRRDQKQTPRIPHYQTRLIVCSAGPPAPRPHRPPQFCALRGTAWSPSSSTLEGQSHSF